MSIEHLSVLLLSLHHVWGKELPREKLIRGGDFVQITSAPHHVSVVVLYELFRLSLCAGFIIQDNWVITAAHCIHSEDPEEQVYAVKVLAGIDDLTHDGFITEVDILEIHPTYYETLALDGDICILRTEDAFPFSDRIQAAVLPSKYTTIYVLGKMMVTGFGLTFDSDMRGIFRLKGLEVTRVIKYNCLKEFEKYYVPGLYESSFCTGSTAKEWRKHSACYGDSGGPVFAKHSNGSFVVYGVLVSAKPPNCLGMNLVAFLPAYLEWIGDVIGEYSDKTIEPYPELERQL